MASQKQTLVALPVYSHTLILMLTIGFMCLKKDVLNGPNRIYFLLTYPVPITHLLKISMFCIT